MSMLSQEHHSHLGLSNDVYVLDEELTANQNRDEMRTRLRIAISPTDAQLGLDTSSSATKLIIKYRRQETLKKSPQARTASNKPQALPVANDTSGSLSPVKPLLVKTVVVLVVDASTNLATRSSTNLISNKLIIHPHRRLHLATTSSIIFTVADKLQQIQTHSQPRVDISLNMSDIFAIPCSMGCPPITPRKARKGAPARVEHSPTPQGRAAAGKMDVSSPLRGIGFPIDLSHPSIGRLKISKEVDSGVRAWETPSPIKTVGGSAESTDIPPSNLPIGQYRSLLSMWQSVCPGKFCIFVGK
nr:hypothetical protein CFP56_69502 [Quercus suber]